MKKIIKLRTFRYGDKPKRGEGLRIGTTRRPPRGVAVKDWPDYFDVWFPMLAPSATLLRHARRTGMDARSFFASYGRELRHNAQSREALKMLAHLSLRTTISVGCYCADESQCHRSHLRRLIERAALKL